MTRTRFNLFVLVLILALCLGVFTACGSMEQPASAPDPATTDDQPGGQAPEVPAPDRSRVLLVVSFGTSYNETRDLTIGAVEQRLQTAYPDYEVRRAFTSQIIIDIMAERESLEIDNVTQAMERLVADGVDELVVQPTHIMSGYEYGDMIEEIAPYRDRFDRFQVGAPLLSADDDFAQVAAALVAETAPYNDENTAIVYMGHGTGHEANAVYATLQQVLADAGHENYFVGTVEGAPELEDVMELVQATNATRVVLLPLMVVAGDHATNDMAGDGEDSWKTAFEAAGYEVECVLMGLGQYPAIQELYVQHVADAMAQ